MTRVVGFAPRHYDREFPAGAALIGIEGFHFTRSVEQNWTIWCGLSLHLSRISFSIWIILKWIEPRGNIATISPVRIMMWKRWCTELIIWQENTRCRFIWEPGEATVECGISGLTVPR